MKKTLKRIAALILSVAMVVCFTTTVFAKTGDHAASGKLVVTGEQLANKTVTAIRMFTARVTEGSTQNNYTFDSYELEEAWLNFFKTDIGKDAMNAVGGINLGELPTDAEYKEASIKYVASLKNAGVADFAHKAQKYYRKNTAALSALLTTQKATQVLQTTKGSATFDSLPTGYYLVFPEAGGTGNENRATDAMLINIPTNKANTEWNIKSIYPTVDKTVSADNNEQYEDNGSAQVGETVTFKLTSSVPDMTDYTTYKFKFVDTMSNGLTFVKAGETAADTDVTVTIGGKKVTQGYKVTLVGQVLTVAFENLKGVPEIKTGDAIVVTYKAIINENAVTTNPVTNSAKVEYSNDPNGSGLGQSTPDETKTYTYDIKVHKYTGAWTNGTTPFLENAVFALSKSKVLEGQNPDFTNAIKLVGSGNSYRVAKADDLNTTATFTTNTAGAIVIKGLEAGTYYLHEIEAPSGYNKLTDPIEIKIEASAGDYSKPVYTINGVPGTTQDSTIPVQNNKGITLPETGSIGTIGLTILGVGIVLAGIFIPRRKKASKQG